MCCPAGQTKTTCTTASGNDRYSHEKQKPYLRHSLPRVRFFIANIIDDVLPLRNGIDEHIIDAANCLLEIGFLYGNDYVQLAGALIDHANVDV